MTPPARPRRADLAARVAAVNRASTNPPAPTGEQAEKAETQEPAPARRASAAPRTRPVRITVDLAPVDHRRLKRWCDDVAEPVGTATVPLADVVRVLLARLHADRDLQAQVIDDLRRRND